MRLVATALALASLGMAAPATAAPVCHEDAPCFNWRTMGNHKRGIVTHHGRRMVVGPVRYNRLDSACIIDYKRTPSLLGDGEARC